MTRADIQTTADGTKLFMEVLAGKKSSVVPFWFMRQAGRYLPEYRELRARKGGFLELVIDPVAACDVTMQPVRRFGMDAAILFSDILVVPMALGQSLEFSEGEGPILNPIRLESDFEKLDYTRFSESLNPIYQTLKNVRSALQREGFEETALIGFAGSPWTVAAYMIEGRGSKDFSAAKLMMQENPVLFEKIITAVTDATIDYLLKQLEAGAEVLQLFDSWAGLLDAEQFKKWVIKPTKKITDKIHVKHPDVKIVGFPRGAGFHYETYADSAGIDALGLDPAVGMDRARALQKLMPVQGNLDPNLLLEGGVALDTGVDRVLRGLSGGPFIFNLGHGIDKNTPVENVERMIRRVKDFRT
ncbi:MAG: uroporphyrinogen decarboxylase [Alphaproteobacteria bacterium]